MRGMDIFICALLVLWGEGGGAGEVLGLYDSGFVVK